MPRWLTRLLAALGLRRADPAECRHDWGYMGTGLYWCPWCDRTAGDDEVDPPDYGDR